MCLIASLLFAISANIDNFSVGISYGMKKIKIGLLSNFFIAAISALGTFLSMYAGRIISRIIPFDVSNALGGLILLILGLWQIIESCVNSSGTNAKSSKSYKDEINCKEILNNPEIADTDKSGCIDIKESVSLAFALTVNNFGLGISASMTGTEILSAVVFTFLFSILMLSMGYSFGERYLSKIAGKYAPLASGMIILALGIYNL